MGNEQPSVGNYHLSPFADIEGSTRLLRELGGSYAQALAGHRRTLREVFTARHGVEVDTQGDAFFYAFAKASDAVEAALAAQKALASGPIRVRIGVHTGEPSGGAEFIEPLHRWEQTGGAWSHFRALDRNIYELTQEGDLEVGAVVRGHKPCENQATPTILLPARRL